MTSERTRKRKDKPPTPPPGGEPEGEKSGERAADGRFLPGHTCNPGGMTKNQRELRALFLEHVPEAVTMTLAMLRGASLEDRRFAVDTILTRGLGKPVKGSDLPMASAVPSDVKVPTDAAGMLAELRVLFAGELARARQRASEGDLGADQVTALANLGRAVAETAAAEEKARLHSEAGKMTLEELLLAAFQEFGKERSAALLAKLPDTPAEELPAHAEDAT